MGFNQHYISLIGNHFRIYGLFLLCRWCSIIMLLYDLFKHSITYSFAYHKKKVFSSPRNAYSEVLTNGLSSSFGGASNDVLSFLPDSANCYIPTFYLLLQQYLQMIFKDLIDLYNKRLSSISKSKCISILTITNNSSKCKSIKQKQV